MGYDEDSFFSGVYTYKENIHSSAGSGSITSGTIWIFSFLPEIRVPPIKKTIPEQRAKNHTRNLSTHPTKNFPPYHMGNLPLKSFHLKSISTKNDFSNTKIFLFLIYFWNISQALQSKIHRDWYPALYNNSVSLWRHWLVSLPHYENSVSWHFCRRWNTLLYALNQRAESGPTSYFLVCCH